ncbi:MAG: flippase-like domain-containing protein [Planctomycetes bacterium]|nr:flippase-like domain-containing protein [Planctomycetota bacterium]
MPRDFALQDAPNAARKSHVSLIARIAVATLALLWVVRGQDWRELAGVFRNLNPWCFALTLVVYTAAQMIIAVRWWLLLRAQSIYIEALAALRLFFLGLFYNNLMLGSVGGDLLKAWYVTKHTDRRLEGALSVFVDRAIGLIGTFLLAALAYVLWVRGHIAARSGAREAGAPGWVSQHKGVIALGTAVAVAAMLAFLLLHPAGRARLARAAAGARCRGISLLRRAKDAIVVYCSRPWTLVWALILTLAGQSFVIVAFWLLGRNLGIDAALRYYFVAFPLGWVVGALPISIAGMGITELGTVGFFCYLTGAPRESVLVLVFCQRFVWVLASLPGGLVHLLGTHLPQGEISIDGPERTN